jgi:hypothetical protein
MNTYTKTFISLLSLLLFVGNVFADSTPPVITLNKGRNQNVQIAQSFVLNEPKSVSDNQTDALDIVIRKTWSNNGTVNALVRGTYTLFIEAEDTSGNIAYDTVNFKVDDFIPPTINLNTADRICVEFGMPYYRVQPTVTDNYYSGKDITLECISSSVNTNMIGLHSDYYQATDASDNYTYKTRLVEVKVGCNTSNINYATLPFNVSIYPNPSNNFINFISNYSLNDAVISIVDVNGSVINEIPFSETIDVSNITNGIYYLRINSNSIYYQTYIDINHN